MELDDVDLKILTLLHRDGRLSQAAIAKRVGMTGPSVYARVQRMEKAGVIRGYAAILDPVRIGQGLVAFIRVTTTGTPALKGEDAFESFVRREPQVLECYSVDGEDSYILKVRTSSALDLQALLTKLRAIRGVSRTVTTIALDTIKEAGLTGPIDKRMIGDR
jgi:Lrp/AsnC family leucine-responsive transcriptional regulator